MKEPAANLNHTIANRVRDLRLARNLSLENMALASGVSRSMISLIERAETSPTAVVLDKIAAALDVSLAALFESADSAAAPSANPLARHEDQPVWQDPASGYVRRNVSPANLALPVQIVDVIFPPRKKVSFDTVYRAAPLEQQVWVLEGTIEITLKKVTHRLHEGDCFAFHLDTPITYYNPTRSPSRYAVVITSGTQHIANSGGRSKSEITTKKLKA